MCIRDRNEKYRGPEAQGKAQDGLQEKDKGAVTVGREQDIS